MNEKDLKSSINKTTEDLGVNEFISNAINVDVIGFGALNVDKLYKVEHIVEIDGESFIKSEEQSPGGSAANTIIGLSKLGCSTSYIGKIAADDDGNLLEYNLMINNIYLTNLIYADKGSSGKVLGFVSDTGDRALYVNPGVNDEIIIDEINLLNVNTCKILHYTSFVGDSFNAQKELLKFLNDTIILSFDPGMLYVKKGVEELNEILKRTNILFINEEELKILFEDYYKKKLGDDKRFNFKDLARYVCADGIDTVVVKRGSKGSYAINKNGEDVIIPAFKCEVIDTTAAGDSFNAGFLYSYLKGYDLVKSCIVANWVASRSVQAIGISGQVNLEDLKKFLNNL